MLNFGASKPGLREPSITLDPRLPGPAPASPGMFKLVQLGPPVQGPGSASS